MAKPAFSKVLTDKEVVFAALTGEGIEGEGGPQYTLAVKVSKKEKRAIVNEVLEFFKEHSKQPKPSRDPNDWFTEDEETGDYILWLNAPTDEEAQRPSHRIKRKRAPGTSYGLAEFETMGEGSIVDVKVRFYMYSWKNKDSINRALSEVTLKEYTPYAGGDDGVSTDGEEIGSDGVDTKSSDEYADLIDEIVEAVEDDDKDEAKALLKELPKDHPAYKKLKKQIKAL